jgi:hypothetical protein
VIGHPTVGWLLERIWYVVSGQEGALQILGLLIEANVPAFRKEIA